jgi:hypothetical protein
MFPEEDPGHEEEWSDLTAAVAAGTLAVDVDPIDWVGFLVHLQPFDSAAELTPVPADGWFEAERGLRRPAVFPLGLPATVRDPAYRAVLEDLTGEKDGDEEPAAPAPPVPVDVFSTTDDFPLTPIEGGPVEISPRVLARLYRLAWFATPSAQPELRVEAENAGALAQIFAGWAGFVARGADRELRVGLPGGGRWTTLRALEAAAADTWTFFPSGSVLELATHAADEDGDPPAGSLRFRGRTEGRVDPCVWRISESYPPASAATLREALALSERSEQERTLALASEEEAQEVLARFTEAWGDTLTRDNPLAQKGAVLTLAQPDRSVVQLLAAEAFRLRYNDIWPCASDEDQGDGEDLG